MKLNHVTLLVSRLDRSAAFYERLGLETIVYEPPRYARLALPGNDATLSIEVIPEAVQGSPDHCIVYFECEDLDDVCSRLEATGLRFAQPPTDMSYLWREARLFDPDGHELRLYHAGSNRHFPPWRLKPIERQKLVDEQLAPVMPGFAAPRIEQWKGSRRAILPLFELADDSRPRIDSYFQEGEVLVARVGNPVGHLQLIPGPVGTEHEIKSLAVLESYQRRGVGRKLVDAAVTRSRAKGVHRLTVCTATSSLGALGFYLRMGFRMARVVRDAFSEASGYDAGSTIDGLPLNDAIVLERDLDDRPV